MEMKQTSFNVDAIGLVLMTVNPQKILEFSAVLVSRALDDLKACSMCLCCNNHAVLPKRLNFTLPTLFLPRER